MTRRALAGSVALVLALGLLGGCGNQEEDYCQALEADQEAFAAMQQDTSGLGLLRQRPLLQRLADNAPDDLADEWQTLTGALDAFSDTLEEVGVDPEDFEAGTPPDSLSDADRSRIEEAADELSSADVVAAANGIEQQAKDVCKLQLGL